jgi:hypothetical protein
MTLSTSSVQFGYSRLDNQLVAFVPLLTKGPVGWVRVWGFVDSGASVSVLKAEEATALGLNLTDGELIHPTVGDGGQLPVYLHRLEVKIDDRPIVATIGFSQRLGVNFNLWGRAGIFDHFEICFNNARQTITFTRQSMEHGESNLI